MKKDKLLEYCKVHDIAVPANASIEYLNAAIVRASFNKKEFKARDGKTCFGFWEYENSTCTTCDFEKKCFRASIGMEKDEYFKKIEALENPRIRLGF